MKNNRRDFLKLTSLAGAGFVGTSFLAGCQDTKTDNTAKADVVKLAERSYTQHFNMSGFAADPIPTVDRKSVV